MDEGSRRNIINMPPFRRMTTMLFFVLFIHHLQTITAFGISSFSYPSQANVISWHGAASRTTMRTTTALSFANPLNDNDKQEVETSSGTSESDGGSGDKSVTLLERARILSYRVAISASALCILVQAVGDVGFLEGTGANIDQIVEQSTTVLPLIAGGTLCLCPVPRKGIVEIGTILLGLATAGSGFVSALTDTQQFVDISWSLSMLALMAVSIREIWYFGVEYKQECVITLLMLSLMLDPGNRIPFTIPLCALGMAVLAAGKIFEPCQEDLVPSNSEFLAK